MKPWIRINDTVVVAAEHVTGMEQVERAGSHELCTRIYLVNGGPIVVDMAIDELLAKLRQVGAAVNI